MLLEKRVGVLSEALEMKDAQLGEVLAAAHLDPATLQQVRLSCLHVGVSAFDGAAAVPAVTSCICRACAKVLLLMMLYAAAMAHGCLQVNKKLEEVLASKNSIIRALQYDVAKVRVCCAAEATTAGRTVAHN